MFAAMSPRSLQRAIDLADWAESQEAAAGSIWASRKRFADSSDAELRLASNILRDRLAKRERVDGLKVQMAECVANVVRLQGDLLKTTTAVIEETAKWLASDPPALRGKRKQGKKS